MPARNPRVNVVLEPPLYNFLRGLAEADGVSLSLKARDLLREAMEIYEDRYFGAVAETRLREWDGTLLTHEEAWGRKTAPRADRRKPATSKRAR